MEEIDEFKKCKISDNYYGIYATIFFYRPDYTPMHFVLSLKDISDQYKSKIVELMEHCGADITFEISEATDYSIVICNHKDDLPFHGPTFAMEYIKECLDKLKVLDISKFKHPDSILPENADCMDVVYFKKLGWKALIHQKNKRCVGIESDSDDDNENDGKDVGNSNKRHFVIESDSDSDDDNEIDGKDVGNSDEGNISTEVDDLSLSGTASSYKKKCTEISKNSNQNNNVEGESIMKEKNVEQFVAHIEEIVRKRRENISSLNRSISSEEVNGTKKEKMKTNCVSDETVYSDESLFEFHPNKNKTSSPTASSTRLHKTKKWSFLDEFCSEDENDDNHQSDTSNSRKRSNEEEQDDTDDMEESNITDNKKIKNTKPLQAIEISSSKGFFDYGFDSDSTNRTEVKESMKRSRMPYMHDERVKILEYITAHNEYSRIKGRELWIIMERRKICASRTWQSMKEHFLKKILTNLDEFTFLTNAQKHKIRNVCF